MFYRVTTIHTLLSVASDHIEDFTLLMVQTTSLVPFVNLLVATIKRKQIFSAQKNSNSVFILFCMDCLVDN